MVKKPVNKIGTSEYTLTQINELEIEDYIKSGLFRLKESPNKVLTPNREKVTSQGRREDFLISNWSNNNRTNQICVLFDIDSMSNSLTSLILLPNTHTVKPKSNNEETSDKLKWRNIL